MRTAFAMALAGALLPVAAAQDAHLAYEVAQAVVGCMEDREPEKVPGELDAEKLALVCKHPKQAYAICRGAADHAGAMARKDAAATATAIEALLPVGEGVRDRRPADALSHMAGAEMLVAHARVLRVTGEADPAPLYREAGDLLLEQHAKEPGRLEAIVRAAEVLHEMAELEGVDAAAVGAELEPLCQAAREAKPKSQRAARIAAASDALQARAIAVKQKGKARKLMKRIVETLEPFMNEGETNIDVATAWNDGMAVNVRRKLGNDAGTLTREIRFSEGGALFEMPISRRWALVKDLVLDDEEWEERISGAGKDGNQDEQLAVDLVQLDEGGDLVRRILVYDFDWKAIYIMGGDQAGADNVKSMSKNAFVAIQRLFDEVVHEKKPAKARFSSHIPPSYTFELAGQAKQGHFVCIRTWFWRFPRLRHTYCVQVLDFTKDKKLDPVVLELLSTFRETQDAPTTEPAEEDRE